MRPFLCGAPFRLTVGSAGAGINASSRSSKSTPAYQRFGRFPVCPSRNRLISTSRAFGSRIRPLRRPTISGPLRSCDISSASVLAGLPPSYGTNSPCSRTRPPRFQMLQVSDFPCGSQVQFAHHPIAPPTCTASLETFRGLLRSRASRSTPGIIAWTPPTRITTQTAAMARKRALYRSNLQTLESPTISAPLRLPQTTTNRKKLPPSVVMILPNLGITDNAKATKDTRTLHGRPRMTSGMPPSAQLGSAYCSPTNTAQSSTM